MKRTLVLLLVFALACGSPTALRSGDGLDIATIPSVASIRLTNRTGHPIFPFVIGRKALAFTEWYPCVDAALCPPIAPGDSRRVPYPATHGAVETEAMVFWWRAVHLLDGRIVPGDGGSLIVRL